MRRDLLEDEANAERWMISYADFITLLFAFFVVMYAISSVNDEKYKVLSDTLAQAFDVPVSSPDPIQIGEPTEAASPHVVDIPDTDGYADPEEGDTRIVDPVEAPAAPAGGFAADAGLSVHSNPDWVEIDVSSDVLFAPGSARLADGAVERMQGVFELLAGSTHPVTIEGYTDNVPSGSVSYPSNWELSSARASAVARLLESGGIDPERISAVGYGENHPVATNATPEGRARNRRVVVVMARRSGLARNLNAGQEPAIAVVRSTAAPDAPITPQRTPDGGLLFTDG